MRFSPNILPLVAAILLFGGAARSQTSSNSIEFSLLLPDSKEKASLSLEAPVAFPGEQNFLVQGETSSWINVSSLEFDVSWPAGAPANAQVLLYIKDWDQFWYQNLQPGYLLPGKTTHFRADLSPSSNGWKPRGHHGTWHLRTLMAPTEFGIRVFCSSEYKGKCRIGKVLGNVRTDSGPPLVSNVRANVSEVPCYGKFEVTFELTDRYPDPFDADKVLVTANFETPTGGVVKVDGFYTADYYAETDTTGEHILPEGTPCWRVRFSPTIEGAYKCTLNVKDQLGEAHWGPTTFVATKAKSHGFVRVCRLDPRRFEFSDSSPYFPIGHNVRSPFDTRMDGQFPWVQRWPEGFTAYMRYFKDMHSHGENLAEVWTASWSLGLEWSPRWTGYHGIGQFNMINAWELDKVLEEAERDEINLNLVIHNHGKFSTFSDEEWKFNPFNVENGGYLKTPEEYFTDERALKSYVKLMRYMTARWGYSAHIFAWELWSEFNLAGSKKDGVENYRRPEAVAWHKRMCTAIKDMDPNHHLISTHVSGDYNTQNKEIVQLPELDFSAVDAYHGNANAVYIVELLRQTANFNNPFQKPVLVTEFGGSWNAQGAKHLKEGLHAGLWAATCIPISGTPMLWWWQLIEEENFYTEYDGVNRFMKGEDLRDPDLLPYKLELTLDKTLVGNVAAQCIKNKTRAQGWIYHSADYSAIDPAAPATTNVVLNLPDMSNGDYRAEFWDTTAGQCITNLNARTKQGTLSVNVPAFSRDIAFKVKPAKK